jgi:hypothetical protein
VIAHRRLRFRQPAAVAGTKPAAQDAAVMDGHWTLMPPRSSYSILAVTFTVPSTRISLMPVGAST